MACRTLEDSDQFKQLKTQDVDFLRNNALWEEISLIMEHSAQAQLPPTPHPQLPPPFLHLPTPLLLSPFTFGLLSACCWLCADWSVWTTWPRSSATSVRSTRSGLQARRKCCRPATTSDAALTSLRSAHHSLSPLVTNVAPTGVAVMQLLWLCQL